MLFFVTSGKTAHRVGMPTTGGGGGRSVQGMVIAARQHCKLCFVTEEWLKSMIRDVSVAAVNLSVCTLGYYEELSRLVSDFT